MKELLRKIPKVDELLRSPALAEATETYGDRAVTEAVRTELDLLRQGILKRHPFMWMHPRVNCPQHGRMR